MNSRLSKIVSLGFFIAVLALVLWKGMPTAQPGLPSNSVFVVTSIYPLQTFVEAVGGEYVYVNNVTPAGAEPHDYEPTPHQVADVLEADVLVFIGGGVDHWVEDLAPEVQAAGGSVLSVEDQVGLTAIDSVETEDEIASDDDHDHEGNVDPHIWLDPVLAQEIVNKIRDSLIAADPHHAETYTRNATAYIAELASLDEAYRTGLARCEGNDIIVSHDAFGYLARRYAFTVHPISGLSPEAEPSVKDLTNLARDARRYNIRTIFFETLVSPELAETLAKEVGAETAVLNPLEGLSEAELAAGETYLSIMRTNLQALQTAMVCR